MAKAKRKRITLEEERDRRFVLAASSSRTNMRARMLQEAARDGIEESEQKRNLILKKMVSELRTLLPILEKVERVLRPRLLVVKNAPLKRLVLKCRLVDAAEGT